MRLRRHLASLSLLAVLAAQPAPASDAAVRVRLEPEVATLDERGRATVVLVVEGVPAPGLAAFQVVLGFDSDHVSVADPNALGRSLGVPAFAPLAGSPLCAVLRAGPCTDPDWLLTSTGRQAFGTSESAGDRVRVAYATAGSGPLPTGDGALAVLELVGSPGAAERLWIVDVVLGDASEPPRRIPVALEAETP